MYITILSYFSVVLSYRFGLIDTFLSIFICSVVMAQKNKTHFSKEEYEPLQLWRKKYMKNIHFSASRHEQG